MAKATAKKRKVIVESTEKLIFLLPSITSSFQQTKKFISFSAGKWVLEVLKNTPYAAQMAAEDCSKVAIEAD
jgi:small subunit ribosomal protein S11